MSQARDVREVATLLEVSQALLVIGDLRAGLAHVLEILCNRYGAVRGHVTLMHQQHRDLAVHATAGAASEHSNAIRYRLGEGIAAEVAKTGRPIVVPRVSKEPRFLNHATGPHQELTHLCLPIAFNDETVGVLGVDLIYEPDRDDERATRFLGTVASMIAQALKAQRADAHHAQINGSAHPHLTLTRGAGLLDIATCSRAMREVYEQAAHVAPTNTTVMLRGESGTGKEVIARIIHDSSQRAKKPFIAVSCAAVPPELIESELFGYEQGAFTGAHAAKKGRFERAEGGTLFLDEIGDISLSTQVKLLRVLQSREFERLGGTHTIRSNVRLISATHRDLEKRIAEGLFREELYYRLNVFAIFVPALRDRTSDIVHLAHHFLETSSRQHRKHIKRIALPALDMLMCHRWPGNIRELENAIEHGVVVCDGQVLHAHHLPPTLQTAEASGNAIDMSLQRATEAFEKDVIKDTLKNTHGNCSRAARLLAVTRRVLDYKVRKYRIDWRS